MKESIRKNNEYYANKDEGQYNKNKRMAKKNSKGSRIKKIRSKNNISSVENAFGVENSSSGYGYNRMIHKDSIINKETSAQKYFSSTQNNLSKDEKDASCSHLEKAEINEPEEDRTSISAKNSTLLESLPKSLANLEIFSNSNSLTGENFEDKNHHIKNHSIGATQKLKNGNNQKQMEKSICIYFGHDLKKSVKLLLYDESSEKKFTKICRTQFFVETEIGFYFHGKQWLNITYQKTKDPFCINLIDVKNCVEENIQKMQVKLYMRKPCFQINWILNTNLNTYTSPHGKVKITNAQREIYRNNPPLSTGLVWCRPDDRLGDVTTYIITNFPKNMQNSNPAPNLNVLVKGHSSMNGKTNNSANNLPNKSIGNNFDHEKTLKKPQIGSGLVYGQFPGECSKKPLISNNLHNCSYTSNNATRNYYSRNNNNFSYPALQYPNPMRLHTFSNYNPETSIKNGKIYRERRPLEINQQKSNLNARVITENMVLYSEESRYGSRLFHFLVYNTKRKRFVEKLYVDGATLPRCPQLGDWLWVQYRRISCEDRRIEVLDMMDRVKYSRETTRFPTRVLNGSVQFCLQLRRKNPKTKKKEIRKLDEEKAFNFGYRKNDILPDVRSLMDDLLSQVVKNVDPPDEGRYQCNYGSVKHVPYSVLKAFIDCDEYDEEYAPSSTGSTSSSSLTKIHEWPERMMAWCVPIPTDDTETLFSWEVKEIDEIITAEEELIDYEFSTTFEEDKEVELSSHIASDLDQSITSFYESKKLSKERKTEINDFVKKFEKFLRKCLIDKLERSLEKMLKFQDISVTTFGSVESGFASDDCDVDICLKIEYKSDKYIVSEKDLICLICQKLRSNTNFANVIPIPDAKVPIVKFKNIEKGITGDMSVGNTLALKNTLLLATYASFDPRVGPLGLFIKQWAKLLGMNDNSRGTLSSYAYIIMLIHFLQRCEPPILPYLQEEKPTKNNNDYEFCEINGWQVNFCKNIQALKDPERFNNKCSVGKLFYQFFLYYVTEFNVVTDIVQIESRKPLSKVDRGNKPLLKLIVQDPFDHDHNLTSGVKKHYLRKLITYMKRTILELHTMGTSPNLENKNLLESLQIGNLVSAIKQRRKYCTSIVSGRGELPSTSFSVALS